MKNIKQSLLFLLLCINYNHTILYADPTFFESLTFQVTKYFMTGEEYFIESEKLYGNINRQSPITGRTNLHDAAEHGKDKTVRNLLHAGASPIITDRDNKKPSDLTKCETIRAILHAAEQKSSPNSLKPTFKTNPSRL